MAKRRFRRVCRKEIQDFGPAKRVCRRVAIKKKRPWCVYKGKSKVPTVCSRTKAKAKKAMARLKRTCKSRLRLRRGGRR